MVEYIESQNSEAAREHLEYLAHEARVACQHADGAVEHGHADPAEDTHPEYALARLEFSRTLVKVFGAVACENDAERLRIVLPMLQHYNAALSSIGTQKRRAPAPFFAEPQYVPTSNPAEIHPFASHAVTALELVSVEFHRLFAGLLPQRGVLAPLLAMNTVGTSSYRLTVPFDFGGFLPTPANMLDGVHPPSWQQVAEFLALSYVKAPRALPSTLRFAPLIAHEQFHRLLLLVEPLIGIDSGTAGRREASAPGLLGARLAEFATGPVGSSLAVLVECYDPAGTYTSRDPTVVGGLANHTVEFIADIAGLVAAGPAFAYALAHELQPARRLFKAPHQEEHPIAVMRLALLERYLVRSNYGHASRFVRAHRIRAAALLSDRVASDLRGKEAVATRWWLSYSTDFCAEVLDAEVSPFDDVLDVIAKSCSDVSFSYLSHQGRAVDGAVREKGWHALVGDAMEGDRIFLSTSPREVLNSLWAAVLDPDTASRAGARRVVYRWLLYNAR